MFPSYDEFRTKFIKLTFSKKDHPSNIKAKYALNKLHCFYSGNEIFTEDEKEAMKTEKMKQFDAKDKEAEIKKQKQVFKTSGAAIEKIVIGLRFSFFALGLGAGFGFTFFTANDFPQLAQNLASSLFSCPHLLQVTIC